MQTVLNITLPIFSLMAIGYAAASAKLMPEQGVESLSAYVFVVAVPLLLFRTLATADFGGADPLLLWLAYFVGVAVTWAAATVILRRMRGVDRRTGVIAGVSASFANTVFVAVPAIDRAYGRDGLEALFLIISVHLPTMMIMATLMMERAERMDARDEGGRSAPPTLTATLLNVLANLSRNAIVIGIVGGFVWRSSGLPLPAQIDEVAGLLGSTAGPVSLFALGMSLTRYGIKGGMTEALVTSLLSVVAMPALVYGVGVALLPPIWLKAAVVTAASPAGINSFLLATHFKSGEQLAATTILVSTILSVATLSLWLLFLG